MIADGLNLTLKKAAEPAVVFSGFAFTALIVTGVATVAGFGVFIGVLAVLGQAGLLIWAMRAYHKAARGVRRIKRLEGQKKQLNNQLLIVKEACEARSKFIETVGFELLESSRDVYEAAEFLNTEGAVCGGSGAHFDVEKSLLSNAGHLFEFSQDIVEFSQLQRDASSLIEQEIDPLELVRFCMSHVEKKYGERKHCQDVKIELLETPAGRFLLTGDLAKLKQLLNKLIGCSLGTLRQGQVNRLVKIYQSEENGLIFSVKLTGYHLSEARFQQLCWPLDRVEMAKQPLNLELAIARCLARLHGGDVVIEEQSASGTVLVFCLPAERVLQIRSDASRVGCKQQLLNRAAEVV